MPTRGNPATNLVQRIRGGIQRVAARLTGRNRATGASAKGGKAKS